MLRFIFTFIEDTDPAVLKIPKNVINTRKRRRDTNLIPANQKTVIQTVIVTGKDTKNIKPTKNIKENTRKNTRDPLITQTNIRNDKKKLIFLTSPNVYKPNVHMYDLPKNRFLNHNNIFKIKLIFILFFGISYQTLQV